MIIGHAIIPILVTMLAAAEAKAPEAQASQVPGTYEVLICKGACDFYSPENILVRGSLVLEAEPYDRSEIPEGARKNFGSGFSLVGVTNGCFVLEILEEERTYAGLIPIGFTRWSFPSGLLNFQLYASADAWYGAGVALTTEGFRGSGYSSGAGIADPNWPPDLVVGRRRGVPDRSVCIKAAEKALEK